ncbi:hypothetical protein ACRRNW_005377, partial [Klebsiella pneumoniae]
LTEPDVKRSGTTVPQALKVRVALRVIIQHPGIQPAALSDVQAILSGIAISNCLNPVSSKLHCKQLIPIVANAQRMIHANAKEQT